MDDTTASPGESLSSSSSQYAAANAQSLSDLTSSQPGVQDPLTVAGQALAAELLLDAEPAPVNPQIVQRSAKKTTGKSPAVMQVLKRLAVTEVAEDEKKPDAPAKPRIGPKSVMQKWAAAAAGPSPVTPSPTSSSREHAIAVMKLTPEQRKEMTRLVVKKTPGKRPRKSPPKKRTPVVQDSSGSDSEMDCIGEEMLQSASPANDTLKRQGTGLMWNQKKMRLEVAPPGHVRKHKDGVFRRRSPSLRQIRSVSSDPLCHLLSFIVSSFVWEQKGAKVHGAGHSAPAVPAECAGGRAAAVRGQLQVASGSAAGASGRRRGVSGLSLRGHESAGRAREAGHDHAERQSAGTPTPPGPRFDDCIH